MILPPNDRLSKFEREIFDLTFELAESAFELHEVPVGCVLVFDKGKQSGDDQKPEESFVVIGKGLNEVNKTRNPTRHAEFVAIEQAEEWCAANNESFAEVMLNTTLYVTLEPCIMCASAFYQLKVKRIVFGACNPRFGGLVSVASNEQYQHEHHIELVSEVDMDRSVALLKRFYGRENPFAPEEKRKSKQKNGMNDGDIQNSSDLS